MKRLMLNLEIYLGRAYFLRYFYLSFLGKFGKIQKCIPLFRDMLYVVYLCPCLRLGPKLKDLFFIITFIFIAINLKNH